MSRVAEWWKNETFIPLDWSPPPAPEASRRRRWLIWLVAGVMAVLVVTAGGLGWLAWQEHSVAQKNEALVHAKTGQLQAMQLQLQALQSHAAQLQSQAGQVGGLQSQVADDRQLLSSTRTVAGELQACIDASGKASNDLFGFISGAQKKADSICNTAEADYQQLLSSSGNAP